MFATSVQAGFKIRLPRLFLNGIRLLGILLATVCLQNPLYGVEVGFYSSSWTQFGIEEGGLGKSFIYQVKYPPEEAVVQRISKSACDKDIAILFRQEIDPNHTDGSLDPVSIDAVSSSIYEAYKNISCSRHSLIVDEENIYWNGRAAVLEGLYRALTDRLSIPILQWYSPNKRNNAPGVNKWPVLSADGWVFDQYTMETGVYEKYVESMRAISERLYSVVWLSPQWEVGAGRRVVNHDYWNEYGKERFVRHVNTNIRNNIPTLFFAFVLDKRNNPISFYKFAEADPRANRFYNGVKNLLKLIESDAVVAISDVPDW